MILGMSLSDYLTKYLWTYLLQTLKMVGITLVIALVFGLLLGMVLFLCRKSKQKPLRILYKVLDFIVGILRSFPFYILIFVLIPVSRIITGDAMSTTGFIVPLSFAAIPFFAKIIESSLIEVSVGVIEAAQALGLSTSQIMIRVVLREALPSIVNGVSIATITLIGYSAMSGAVGAESLGAFAYNYGMISYDIQAMMYAVVTIVLLVLIVQGIGNFIYKLVK
ncbi:MAG TPA: ABC transporter permease [Candidatus Pelethenecus faecipullorum]|uniref:ABC transporter permease n=1 Tax=Candidatus Pelethenecus faecipullorum TaxID=2840900 RepID=A0A9D1KJA8_9MOLU|nr:ABC transporter permease [Candidatus Pelethenecus faecipullorum]